MTPKSKAEIALLSTTLIWGNTFVAMKIVLQDTSPMMNVALRFGIASLIFLLIFRKKLFPLGGKLVKKGFLLGFFLFLGFIAQNIGLQYTTASKSAFITGLMVLFVPFLQIFIEKKAPRLGNILGIVLVVAGLWFLTAPAGSEFNTGDALTIICAICFAVYIIYLDIVSREMTAAQLTFLQIAATAIYGSVILLLTETPTFVMSTSSFIALVFLTLCATVLTTYVQTKYQKDTTPTRAVIIFSIEPVIAAISAYFILGERIGALGVFGGGLIIAGVLLSELSDSIPVLNKPVGLPD